MASMAQHTVHDRWEGAREVMGMSWPIILGSLSYTIMEFADRIMVAQLGTQSIAAVGSAGLWSFLLSTVFLGIVGCVSTFVAQSVGRGNVSDAGSYTWQGLYIGLGAGAATSLLWPLTDWLFGLMAHSPEVTALETGYFRVRLLGYIAMTWSSALVAFFTAIGRPKVTMYIAIIANGCNIVLNYLLIYGHAGFPRLGVNGAALATIISQWLHAVLLLALFLRPAINMVYNTRGSYAFHARRARELLRIGFPSGLTFLMDVATWGVFVSFIVGRFGDVPLAANNIAVSFMSVSFMPAVAVNQAITAIVGRWIGRGDVVTAKARTYTALRICISYMVFMGIVFALSGGLLIRLVFSDDPVVIGLGHRLLILAAVFQAFDATNIVCMGALRGAGDTRWMMWMTFFAAYVFFLPLAVVIAFLLKGGAYGAWIGATIYIFGLSGVLFTRFRGERWRHINIFTARP